MAFPVMDKNVLHKNQHTERKLLNFENWTNGEPTLRCQINESTRLAFFDKINF